jgi:Caspase domain
MNKSGITWIIFIFLTFFVGIPASLAATKALLIGVSGYPSLDKSRRLVGPANDVNLLRSALLKRGISQGNVKMLADGVRAADGLPTKANIMNALQNLSHNSKAGDWVIVYFAGHGSQQLQELRQPPSRSIYIEPDGLDEVFLPYDVGRWDGGIQAIKGAISDDEIAVQLSAMLRKKLHVWIIFDTCHAGDMTKGGDWLARRSNNRFVPPAEFGVPINPTISSDEAGRPAVKSLLESNVPERSTDAWRDQTPTGVVAFYASQTDEPAAEELLVAPGFEGKGKSGPRYYGLFTYLLAKELLTWQGDFHQLAKKINQGYLGRPYPTPMFEGDLGQTPKF